jgi:hypothetical protein
MRRRSSGSEKVLEDELGLEDAPEVPIGAVEPVLGA